jgi:hypothetical protein
MAILHSDHCAQTNTVYSTTESLSKLRTANQVLGLVPAKWYFTVELEPMTRRYELISARIHPPTPNPGLRTAMEQKS